MSINGYVVKRPLNVLTNDELERVHGAMLEVLERTGVVIESVRALEVLADAGCKVEQEKKRVRFPHSLVEGSLKRCPSRVTLKARNPQHDVTIGGNRVHFCPWIGMDAVDVGTWERRTPTEQDWINASRVLDYLEEVHIYAFGPHANVDTASGRFLYPWVTAFNLRHTQKAIFGAGFQGNHVWSFRMFEVVGVKPPILVSDSPPLAWPGDQVDLVFAAAEAGFPLRPVTGVVSGAGGPATLAGTLVQGYAQIAAIIVLAQTVKPGMEVIVTNYTQAMGMRDGTVIQGGVERPIMDAAWSQIWRKHGIPCKGIMGSDSKVIDYQCAMEKAVATLYMVLAGNNMLAFIGGVYDELYSSPIAAILDNDLAKMIARIVEGITVTDETLAVDLINEVGPIPGSFLGQKHTANWWKKEQMVPGLADRLSYPAWVKAGKKDSLARAKEKYDEIVAKHEVPPLPADQDREIERLLEGARKELT